MKNRDEREILGDAVKGGVISGMISVSTGIACVPKLVIGGVVLLSSPISWSIVACCAATGAAVAGVGSYAVKKLKELAIEREFEEAMEGENYAKQRAE